MMIILEMQSKTLINKIPIHTALIDSLSLKIPFSECSILDERLTSYTAVYYASLDEVDCELHPPKPIIIEQFGITLRIGLVDIPLYDESKEEKVLTKFINLTLSSKLLKRNYFEGIRKENIMQLYNEFIALDVFRCSYDSFLNGYVSDIDICVNLHVESRNHFQDALNLLVTNSGVKSRYCHLINKKENLGLTFNNRNYAKPSTPFIKLYFKQDELKSKSSEFYETFLKDEYSQQITGLTRIEATIKNYAHKQRLAKYNILPQFKTLKELLDLSKNSLQNFIRFSLKSYVEPTRKMKSPNLSPTDHIIFELIQKCIQMGHDEKSILSIAESFETTTEKTTANARSRIRTKIKNMMGLIINTDIKIQSKLNYNAHVLSYLGSIGIKF